jgi:flagellin
VDQSISRVASLLNDIGVFQTQLTNREYFLTSAIISNEQARSRIMDADFAKVKSRAIAQEILLRFQNFALTQANLTPRSLLRILG